MATHFTLELYFEDESDKSFAECEKLKLVNLVSELAPHIDLEVLVLKASAPTKLQANDQGKIMEIPVHLASSEDRQSLLISSQSFERKNGSRLQGYGWGLPHRTGYLSKNEMARARENSADITIHEWIHTLDGLEIDGAKIPNPDSNEIFGVGPDPPRITWYNWFQLALNPRLLPPKKLQGIYGPTLN